MIKCSQKRSAYLIASLIALILTPELAIAQNAPGMRQVRIEALNEYAPVKVTAVIDHGHTYPNPLGAHQTVTLTDSDASWVANVSLAILNQSTKHILAIEAQLDVPVWQDDPPSPRKSILFYVGKLPTIAPIYGTEKQMRGELQSPIDIKPESQYILPLTDGFPMLRDYPLRPTPIESVSEVWVRVRRVFFDDGTMWVTNAYMKPDESQPGAYKRISREEFSSPK
jgi:hypothetical protein